MPLIFCKFGFVDLLVLCTDFGTLLATAGVFKQRLQTDILFPLPIGIFSLRLMHAKQFFIYFILF
jgi:hypothetical protein